jgi:hypothetical protein
MHERNLTHTVPADGELPEDMLAQFPAIVKDVRQQPKPKPKRERYVPPPNVNPMQVLCLEICLLLAFFGVFVFMALIVALETQ